MDLTWVAGNATALFLLWLLVSSGSQKLQPAHGFYYEVVFQGYGIHHPLLARHLPKVLGLFEIVVGMAIAVPSLRVLGGSAAAALLSAYLVLIAWQLVNGKADMDCGCAGPEGEVKISPHLLVRNLVLVALALFSVMAGSGSGVMPWVLSTLMAAVLVLVYLSSEQLIATAQRIGQMRSAH
ncbi:hypothetical protein HBA55_23585 [Pseudomaricurvus alkylphenolicus]|jgi:hypothetical protein|uniref:MauE/DoxX family redox-associated membrane protein n=1 Tax=Pseudomaricurvus alkylphenolicus TaxID=1306991 RepID=UPI00141FA441|nr:MauE/DoxX family redox-associated membrane protein [Pseudomaricurvus alkylphenolicus]NIB42610.1 hypothetical protein [Pseudomaricurvus alkylphenolicus]